MSGEVYFSKDLVFKNLEFKDNTEALRFLATKLWEKGYVKKEYEKAILDREKDYPTALPSIDVKIAIPHADHKLVNKASLAVGVLKNPVEFRAMDDPDKKLNVSIIIMLALSEPHGHIEMLQKIVKLIQNSELLKQIVKASSDEEIIDELTPYIMAN